MKIYVDGKDTPYTWKLVTGVQHSASLWGRCKGCKEESSIQFVSIRLSRIWNFWLFKGSGNKESISSVMIIGKTCLILRFGFCERCLKYFNLQPGNKNNQVLFLLMFSYVTFHLETFPTNMTFKTSFIWLYIWKRLVWQCNVKSVENISGRKENQGTHAKKALGFFWFLDGDFNISDIFYKIQISN